MGEIQALCGQCGEVLHVKQGSGAVKCAKCGHLIDLSGGDDSEAQTDTADMLADDEGFAVQARSLILPKVRTACPECGKVFSAEASLAGRETNCPACNVLVRVPYPGEEQSDPDETEAVAPPAPLDEADLGAETNAETKTSEEPAEQDRPPEPQPTPAPDPDQPRAAKPPSDEPPDQALPASRIETIDASVEPRKSFKRPLLALAGAIVLLLAVVLYFLWR